MLGLLYPPSFANRGQISRVGLNSYYILFLVKCRFDCYILSPLPCEIPPQYCGIWLNIEILGLMYPLYRSGPNFACESIPAIYAHIQISSGSVYCVALDGEKPRILPHSQLHHSVMAPSNGAKRNLNADAQLQFPLSNNIKSVFTYKRFNGEVTFTTFVG